MVSTWMLYICGVLCLLTSQFFLIVRYLWAEPVGAVFAFWIIGLILTAVAYFRVVWSKKRRRYPIKAERLFKVIVSVVTLIAVAIGTITPLMFITGERYGPVIEGTVAERHIPISYAITPCAERGTMEALDYETPDYDGQGNDTGKNIQKRLRVYLPAGYSPERSYNILYMLNFDEDLYFNGGHESNIFRNTFDHMISNAEIEPLIVVACATGNHSSDVVNEQTQTAFQQELRNVILPLVETTYSTYAEGTDPVSLEASRSHRMVTGFSNGGYATMYTFLHSLDYFSCFIPTGGSLFDNVTVPQRLMEAVDAWDDKYGTDDYVLAFGTGGRDMSYPGILEQYELIQKEAEDYFVPDNTLEHGNFCLQIGQNYRHGAEAMLSYLYVYLPMIETRMAKSQ